METNTTASAPKITESVKQKRLLAGYVDERDVAAELEIEVRTLRRMVNGPPFVLLNRKRRYPEDKFRQWLTKQVHTA
jgi:hypothetical protein